MAPHPSLGFIFVVSVKGRIWLLVFSFTDHSLLQLPSGTYSLRVGARPSQSLPFLFLHLLISLQTKATGEILLDEVYKHLGLEETDYFGLQFIDKKQNVVSVSCSQGKQQTSGKERPSSLHTAIAAPLAAPSVFTSCAHVLVVVNKQSFVEVQYQLFPTSFVLLGAVSK